MYVYTLKRSCFKEYDFRNSLLLKIFITGKIKFACLLTTKLYILEIAKEVK